MNIEGEDLKIYYRALDTHWSKLLEMSNKYNDVFSEQMLAAYQKESARVSRLLTEVRVEMNKKK